MGGENLGLTNYGLSTSPSTPSHTNHLVTTVFCHFRSFFRSRTKISNLFSWNRTRFLVALHFWGLWALINPLLARLDVSHYFFWNQTTVNPKLCPISDFGSRRRPISKIMGNRTEWEIHSGSGPTSVARGGSGAKAPPLAARPRLRGKPQQSWPKVAQAECNTCDS